MRFIYSISIFSKANITIDKCDIIDCRNKNFRTIKVTETEVQFLDPETGEAMLSFPKSDLKWGLDAKSRKIQVACSVKSKTLRYKPAKKF